MKFIYKILELYKHICIKSQIYCNIFLFKVKCLYYNSCNSDKKEAYLCVI